MILRVAMTPEGRKRDDQTMASVIPSYWLERGPNILIAVKKATECSAATAMLFLQISGCAIRGALDQNRLSRGKRGQGHSRPKLDARRGKMVGFFYEISH